MHTVVSASIGTTPSGLPRSRGSACCSTEAKYELKSTRSDRSVIGEQVDGDKSQLETGCALSPSCHGRGIVIGRFVAFMNLRPQTIGAALSVMGATEVPAPEMK